MQIAYIPEELLRQLLYIRKCYHARYPTNLTALTLPSPDLMSNWDVQTWLVHHLLEEESVHLARYKRSLSVAGNEKSSSSTQHMLGAVRWRRAFHKRLVQHIEHGLSITADTVRLPFSSANLQILKSRGISNGRMAKCTNDCWRMSSS